MSEKINVMLTTENMEKLQMAAMVAAVGAVSGNDVSVFLSMNALKYLGKKNKRTNSLIIKIRWRFRFNQK